ncbi:outer membrane channel protein TolC [Gallaecimonas sp. GXIMD4217]|uniref:outer membrane channel protein TolC n=1 Tax=Gallaecimonas sp. GXIMD4217 TaxID=3131927 RepID=UPI00311ADF92
MKKSLLSLLVGLGLSQQAQAVDLMDVYKQALQNDPQLLQSAAQKDVAAAGVGINRASLLPQLSAQFGYAWNDSEFAQGGQVIGDSSHGWDATLNLSQEIYHHDSWIRLDRAEKQATQATVAYSADVQALMIRVANAYFNVLLAQDTLAFRQAEKRAIERQLEQTKQRFAVGLTAITDVHEAQAQYDTALANEIQAQNDLENSYEGLSEITGVNYDNLDVLNTKKFSPTLPDGMVEAWVKRAEDQNLNLQASRMGVEIARDDIKTAQAGHYPTVDLTARYNTADDASGPRLDNSSIGIGVTVPLFSGYRTTSQVEQAKANYQVTAQQLEQTYRSVVRSVRNTYNNVRASLSSVKAFEQSEISSQSALEATEAGFEVGTRTIVDVLNANRQLYQTKQQLAQARYTYINNILALKQAEGSLGEADLDAINAVLTAMVPARDE